MSKDKIDKILVEYQRFDSQVTKEEVLQNNLHLDVISYSYKINPIKTMKPMEKIWETLNVRKIKKELTC